MKIILLVVFFTSFTWCFTSASPIQCRDEGGKPVDWFVAYKLPRIKHSHLKYISEGVGYIFITSNSLSGGWMYSSFPCNDSQSIMGQTLDVLYGNEVQTSAKILYNDEPPSGNTSDTFGHTKGVVLTNDEGGLWLIHSVPHFPPISSSHYSYPASGVRYGQSFLCVSFPLSQMDNIGLQLMYNEPIIYDMNIPSEMETTLPRLSKAAKGEHISSSPWFNSVELTSLKGETFVSFAKSMHFGKDLYADWVAAYLKIDLAVETWSNGPGRMPSKCNKPFMVENVELLSVQAANFSTHQDHSKWAAALTDSNPWLCIGDINRMIHQKQRGGGTLCLQNLALWHAYRDSVATLDVCPLFPRLCPQNIQYHVKQLYMV